MGQAFLAWLKRHALAAYFVLAFAISWTIKLPLAAAAQSWFQTPFPPAIHYLAAFGPLAAAMTITAATEGRQGVRRLLAAVVKWRVGWFWTFVSLSPIALFAIAAIIGYLADHTWPDLTLLGEVDYLPYLGVAGAFLLWLLTFGMGEEVGWRGYALPRLQRNRSALSATLLLGMLWALWHLPAFFYRDTYMAMGLTVGFPLLLLSITAASIIFTWLYNSTHGSLLPVILFHTLFDLLSVAQTGVENMAAVMSAGVLIAAVVIVIWFKPTHLSHMQRHTGLDQDIGT